MKNLTKKWIDFARADMEAAKVLLKAGETHWSYQLCVLHCHQAIEKILKTVIVENGDEVKKIHDLVKLLRDSKLELPENFQEHIDNLNPHYQLPRYPDIRYKGPILRYNEKVAREYFDETKQVFLWIEKKLTLKK